ncbi:hypothetical protein CUC08_Gglean001536 [Alternaria sp. MG1]|jgi:hypothetical protein|uniref:Fungal N-terminal domain-containing protein n=2 Tax=Alternaria alternata complex TaxID=187734 RepID=A0A4Q4NNL7_ALTAL|nr:hypothetical protein CUC08_Gglean001536 [Alternaria sp. MG1]RYN27222.1 hypothetical protein AA0115_g6731 [Alternaria tenuissima]RYN79551.1 hypothetical protein AA0117_g3774 [Alternaria alternata]RYN58848.1 hypothetical protein AA0114_g1592 [Alternaria tenuissima]RYN60417.1 hypothetical protein AA0118_g6141 [Alternaria tenuissima]
MSAGLEFAAGIFAIIGVAEVIVRTGREVHGFLRDISGAPEEIDRLCTTVKETTLLAETVKQILETLASRKPADTTDRITALFESALKSLQRELQNLRILNARFRGVSNKTWSRVKYVLDERKVNKMFNNLERAKSLLANSLHVASRQRSDDQHLETLKRHNTTQKLLASTKRNQATLIQGQELLGRLAVCHYQETKRASKEIAIAHQEHLIEHQRTRDVLSAKLEDVIVTQFEKYRISRARSVSTRDVFFFGERRDMIMAYLLIVKPHLEVALANLFNDGISTFPPHYISWLQSEYENLIASAAQEEATKHPQSTATSLDRWHYSEETKSRHLTTPRRVIGQSKIRSTTQEAHYANLYLSTPAIAHKSSYTHTTPFGSLRLQTSRRASRSKLRRPDEEASFTFTCGIGRSLHAIHAHFLRNASGPSNPRLCAQLSVFTLAESETHYNQLFASASAHEIDDALRQGVISPYEINREGRNLCLYYAAEHTRIDLFDYLASQGIGVSNLNHDVSLVAGLFMRSIVDHDRVAFERTVDHIIPQVYESSSFLFETTMNMLLWDYYKGRSRSLLGEQIQRLQQEGLISESVILNDDPWDWPSVAGIIAPLFEIDAAYINTMGSLGRNRIQRCYCVIDHEGSPGDPMAIEEIANALIRAGIDVHHRDHDGLTPSMYAKRCGAWDGWCSALARNGLRIEDVVREEKAEWLLEEGWREHWVERYEEIWKPVDHGSVLAQKTEDGE